MVQFKSGDVERLVKWNAKLKTAENMRFDPQVDLEIISAYRNQRPSACNVIKSPIPLYRCYFIEDQTVATYMTHILKSEYKTFLHILKRYNYQPSIQLFVITDNEVILEEKVSGSILAHLLFRFHHRIAKKYISDELFMIGGNQ
ncbi:MAG TPA: hypothetical protein PLU95_03620 [Syntrophales bacterium]|nr:hypothetical protein [Syntrophales bacterium]